MTRRRLALGAAVAALATTAVSGCGSTPLDARRLEASIAPTFARLYVQQQALRGDPRPAPERLRSRAQCVKGAPGDVQHGAGDDWTCYVSYLAAGTETRVVATYTVDLRTNGCYAADGDGPTTLNGTRTITGRGFRQVLNPLWLVNGCFAAG